MAEGVSPELAIAYPYSHGISVAPSGAFEILALRALGLEPKLRFIEL